MALLSPMPPVQHADLHSVQHEAPDKRCITPARSVLLWHDPAHLGDGGPGQHSVGFLLLRASQAAAHGKELLVSSYYHMCDFTGTNALGLPIVAILCCCTTLQVRLMADVLLVRLGFECAVVHLEPVAAAFGSSCSAACIVDVGDASTRCGATRAPQQGHSQHGGYGGRGRGTGCEVQGQCIAWHAAVCGGGVSASAISC